MSHHDPFDTAREEVTEKLRVASALHEVYLEQLSASNTDPFALKDISSQLQKEVKGVEWFVSDLEETIFIVEKDPLKFGIDQNEMKNRKNFIKNTKDTIKRIKEDMNQKQKQQSNKQARDRLMGEQPQKKDRFSKLDDSINQDNQSYIDNQLLLQNKTIEQQDRGLDQASQGIERVQHIAIAMGDELSDQNRELEEMERDVERTQGMMKRTMNRLNKLLNQTSDKGKIIMIIILVVIIIGLVAVILAV